MIRHNRKRRGIASMLAMLYLVLFSALALGFYAATTTSNEVVANDRLIAEAQSAAESGMDFMRYQLSLVTIPAGTNATTLQSELYKDLQQQLNASANLGSNSISSSDNVIQIPSSTSAFIPLDKTGDKSFRATITVWTGDIVVKVEGRTNGGKISRFVQMDYEPGTHTTQSFNFAVASRGQVVMKKGSLGGTAGVDNSVAQVMSASGTSTAISVSGGTIGGDLSILDGAGVTVTGGTVGGSSISADILANHVKVVNDPDFPDVDPTVYKKYATNAYVAKAKTQSNIIIPPNTNPKFNANDTVQGIMYIQSPNQVTFLGNFKLQGFIVMESGVATDVNSLSFSGNLTQSPVPAGPSFDQVRAVSGVAILAPSAAISMSGSTDSFLRGSIIIPPNTNPKFNANDTVQGIMYIQSPNQVTFLGNFKLQGFIVMESGVATDVNSLSFSGNLTQSPVPAGPSFDQVRAVSGVAILAPSAAISMSGSTDSFLRGSIITNTFSFNGSADIQIDQGTLMTLSPNANSAVFNGKTVKFTANGSHNVPAAGLTYSGYYKPKLGSYVEVLP